MIPFDGGTRTDVDDLLAQILREHAAAPLEGITLLGGEPFAHASGASELARKVRVAGLSVMAFSGWTLGELRGKHEAAIDALLAETDILVDGPFVRELPEASRRWIGSANQQVHFLTDRCRADDPRWTLPNTLEIRYDGETVLINGFPAAGRERLWRRLHRQSDSPQGNTT
jgi:anaerobic ribonucleoside-triphosphate reductase activating protein